VLTFRAAVPADVPAVVRLVESAYRGEASKRGWTTEADLLGGQRTDPESVAGMVAAAGSRVELGFDAEGALAACVNLKEEADGSLYVGMLAVDPARQAGGLGKELLARAEAFARERGLRRLRMTVIDRRPELIAYYERRGYARTGRTEPFPEHDPRFGLPKVRGLVFAELAKPLA
jgi:GNAT superfamily N-acetyltransferase